MSVNITRRNTGEHIDGANDCDDIVSCLAVVFRAAFFDSEQYFEKCVYEKSTVSLLKLFLFPPGRGLTSFISIGLSFKQVSKENR
mmetsp:Transcript_2215/g.6335  ORF Transcript_2215/g.6335 Transcript_2215/m.6335 type:complete len:85 (-) Transcript_2215:3075-3329(-)